MEASIEKVQYPFSIKLVIPEYSLKDIPENNDHYMESERSKATTIPGLTYFLRIKPRNMREEWKNQTQISLVVKLRGIDSLSADCIWTVESTGYKRFTTYIYSKNASYGPHICSYEDLMNPEKKWLVDGKLTVELTGVFSTQSIVFQDRTEAKNLLLSNLWKRTDKDFTLVVGDKEIKVHKPVLANASTVFNQMFETQWKETTEGKYTIEDFDHDTVDAAVQFIYSKPINTVISKALSLMRFADKYDIAELKSSMEDYLIGKINNVTAVQLSNASVPSNAPKLRQKCCEYLLENFRKTYVSNLEELDADFKDKFMKEAFTSVFNIDYY